MVSAGDTCIASAVPLPLPHYQAVPIAFSTVNNTLAMNVEMVNEIRQKLLLVVGNNDESVANDVITELENAALSKEILEVTRIGRYVNEVRKQTAERWPEFSKRCRAIIKQWQKLAEYRPSSSCGGSSNGGTPQLISPALRRGLTPKTPGKQQHQIQRVTSTDLTRPKDNRNVITGSPQSKTISPTIALANGLPKQSSGSYAPLSSKKISSSNVAIAQLSNQVHKSASMGAALSSLNDAQKSIKQALVNGSSGTDETEKIEPPDLSATSLLALTNQPPLMLKLKRSASGVQRLSTTDSTNGTSPPALLPTASTESIVQAARKNVQSTAELMAQLSEQLPQHIGKIYEVDTNSIQQPQAIESETSSSPSVSTIDFINKTDKTTEIAGNCEMQETVSQDASRNVVEILKMEEEPVIDHASKPKIELVDDKNESTVKRKRGRPKKVETEPLAKPNASTASGLVRSTAKFNWFKKFRHTSTGDSNLEPQQLTEDLEQIHCQYEHSFVLPVRQRHLLLLPYIDIGRPDWLVHNLPEQESFLFPDQFNWS